MTSQKKLKQTCHRVSTALILLLTVIAFVTPAITVLAQELKNGKDEQEKGFARIPPIVEQNELTLIRQMEDGTLIMEYAAEIKATIFKVYVEAGKSISSQHEMFALDLDELHHINSGGTYKVLDVHVKKGETIENGAELCTLKKEMFVTDYETAKTKGDALSFGGMLKNLWRSTGIRDIIAMNSADWRLGIGKVVMIMVGLLLVYLAIFKQYEPLLLIPIGIGAILVNIPIADIGGPNGLQGILYAAGIENGLFPLLIFMGVGVMTDFGPLIANPKTALLGAAAQFGIFTALLGALLLTQFVPGIDFDLDAASAIGIIGGADGPTSIYVASKLAPDLLGAIAVAAYSYMALVPIIQPPIIKAFTTSEERKIKMEQLRPVSRLQKIMFPLGIILLCALILPDAAPLIGMLMFGNLMRECMVVERLSDTAQNALINIVTIFLGLTVGSKLSADKFLSLQTLGILLLGLFAFLIGTATGTLFGKLMCHWSGKKINPMIGGAGVSAVPMAARVVNKMGMDENSQNFLLMHAMGPNVAGVIGSAVAAGLLLNAGG